MKQDDVAGKILMELTELEIAAEDNEWIIYNYLSQAYSAGYDMGRKRSAFEKPVGQYTKKGELIKIWDSASAAARGLKMTRHTGISNACLGYSKTCQGYYWKYVNKPISSKATTVGQLKSKSTQPEPKSHVSKTAPPSPPQEPR